MNIYLKVEIYAREFESRLLVALIAAERGHDVLVGDLRTLLSHRRWLRPGLLHDNSLTPVPRKVAYHSSLVEAGFIVTSQDEEHGLLQPTYDEYIAQRFSDASLTNAAVAFTWNGKEAAALEAAHPLHADRVVATGSPRVDLWRPEFAAYHRSLPAPGADPDRQIVLLASNVSVTNQNRFWVNLREQRPGYFRGEDDPREFDQYDAHGAEYRFLGKLVRGLRAAAHSFPEVQFVIRPHPTEHEGAWEDLLGPVPANVIVTRQGGLGRWIHRAALVIHNGSTSAIEATVAGVPTIAFIPDDWRRELLSNRLGRCARDTESLLCSIEDRLRSGAAAPDLAIWSTEDPKRILDGRLAALDGPLAAERIVDAWESIDIPGRTNRLRAANAVARTHRTVGSVRARLRAGVTGRTAFDLSHKFPILRQSELDRTVDAFRTSFSRFSGVDAKLFGPRLVRVRRS